MEINAEVKYGMFLGGTKVSYVTAYVEIDGQQYRLRSKEGNLFKDPIVEGLNGKTIKAIGQIVNHNFVIDSYEII